MLIKIKQDNMKPLKQMQVDPLTGMPVIAPGVQDPMPARSSELYEGADPGYAQGSMETAMKANPMMTGLGQYGLKQNKFMAAMIATPEGEQFTVDGKTYTKDTK